MTKLTNEQIATLLSTERTSRKPDLTKYGAWLAPDGRMVFVDYSDSDHHYRLAKRANQLLDPNSISESYRLLLDSGFARLTFGWPVKGRSGAVEFKGWLTQEQVVTINALRLALRKDCPDFELLIERRYERITANTPDAATRIKRLCMGVA